MKLAELTHVDQLQLELVRHGWQKCLDHRQQTNSAFFVYSEDRCPCCEEVNRALSLYPQPDYIGTDLVVQASVNKGGQIIDWSFLEAYGPSSEDFEPGDLGLEPSSIASAINSWLESIIGSHG